MVQVRQLSSKSLQSLFNQVREVFQSLVLAPRANGHTSELYQVATKFGIIENGRIIKEISKADFDTQSEDYIVLKTSHINEASQILQDQMNYRIKVTNADNEIHVFGQSHSIKGIVKELVANAVDIDEIYYKRQDLEDYFTQIVE